MGNDRRGEGSGGEERCKQHYKHMTLCQLQLVRVFRYSKCHNKEKY